LLEICIWIYKKTVKNRRINKLTETKNKLYRFDTSNIILNFKSYKNNFKLKYNIKIKINYVYIYIKKCPN
jgi:hypothetical protein